MYNADVFMKNSCEVTTANVIYNKGKESKVEYGGNIYAATYDTDHKMFVVDDKSDTDIDIDID